MESRSLRKAYCWCCHAEEEEVEQVIALDARAFTKTKEKRRRRPVQLLSVILNTFYKVLLGIDLPDNCRLHLPYPKAATLALAVYTSADKILPFVLNLANRACALRDSLLQRAIKILGPGLASNLL